MERVRRSLNIRRAGVQPAPSAGDGATSATGGMVPVAEGATASVASRPIVARLSSADVAKKGSLRLSAGNPLRFSSDQRPLHPDVPSASVSRRALTTLERNMVDAAATGNLEALAEVLDPVGVSVGAGAGAEAGREAQEGGESPLRVDVNVQEWTLAQIREHQARAMQATIRQQHEQALRQRAAEGQGKQEPQGAARQAAAEPAADQNQPPPRATSRRPSRIVRAFRQSRKVKRRSMLRQQGPAAHARCELVICRCVFAFLVALLSLVAV